MEVPLTTIILVFLITIASASYDFVVKPEFGEKARDLNITSYAGQTSRLPCTVKHLSGKRVSWIRQRDLQVLSTGRITFSTDLRISVLPGTRFKLRKPRDLLLTQHHYPLPPLVTNRTPNEENYPVEEEPPRVNEDQMLTSPLALSHWLVDGASKEGQRTPPIIYQLNQTRYSTSLFQAGINLSGNKYSLHPHQWKHLKRKARNIISHKHHKRQKKYWYKEEQQNPLNFHHRYAFNRNPGRFKKALTTSFQKQHEGFTTKAKSLVSSSAKGQRREKFQAYAKENNPIAIYPQGPISGGSDTKSLQLAPNYIDGVWEPEDYTLQIKYTKPQDAGTYICQINTEPRITQAVLLRVVKMRAEILGRQELFVKAGNPVRLSCKVNHGALSPGFILWYKGERLVEYENSGGRIQVMTETGGVSHLLLHNAQPNDSANYTCSPAGGAPASLILNVIVDERQAAMQQGNHCPPSLSSSSPCSMVLWPTAVVVLAQLLSSPSNHLPSISPLLFPSILVTINILLSSPFKIMISIVLLLWMMLSFFFFFFIENCCWNSTPPPSMSHIPFITSYFPSSSSIIISNFRLLLLFGCWIVDVTKCFLSSLHSIYKENQIICSIVSMCVFVSLAYYDIYISQYMKNIY